MSQVPFKEAERIRNDARLKFQGKSNSADKMMGYELGGMYECNLKQAVITEADCLWSVISEYQKAAEDGEPCPHPTSFIQHTRAKELLEIRKPSKKERPR